MARIEGYVGALRPTSVLPSLPLQLGGIRIEESLMRGASDGGTRPLRFDLSYSNLASGNRPNNEPSDIPTLQASLTSLFPGQPSSRSRRRVGLVLADTYTYSKTVLGLMFDIAPFAGEFYREGAAVFLDSIRSWRKSEGPQAQADEMAFTAIHELGHCFNLWHAEKPEYAPNFMMSSGKKVFDLNAWNFHPDHESYLRLAGGHDDVLPYVLPGGTPFDTRPDGWGKGTSSWGAVENNPREPAKNDLRLHIALDRQEMWYFEPLELDLRISAKRGARVRRIPDQIDPGYERLRIWLEEPDGRRSYYRPPVRYCSNPAKVVVAPGRDFVRDVTLFAGAAGYTFKTPGIYRIRASYRVGPREVLWSNIETLNVKPARPGMKEYENASAILKSPQMAHILLYHRPRRLRLDVVRQLAEVAKRIPDRTSAGAVRYESAQLLSRIPASRRGAATRQVLSGLERSILDGGHGRYREQHALELVDTLRKSK